MHIVVHMSCSWNTVFRCHSGTVPQLVPRRSELCDLLAFLRRQNEQAFAALRGLDGDCFSMIFLRDSSTEESGDKREHLNCRGKSLPVPFPVLRPHISKGSRAV